MNWIKENISYFKWAFVLGSLIGGYVLKVQPDLHGMAKESVDSAKIQWKEIGKHRDSTINAKLDLLLKEHRK